MRHLSDLLANALPRPFRRRNAARQAGSISWSRAIRPRRQASGCLSARCTCGEAVRSPDERSEELCEAKSQEGAREPRRVSTDRRSLPKAVSRVVPQGAERKQCFPTLYTLYMFYTAKIIKTRGASAARR